MGKDVIAYRYIIYRVGIVIHLRWTLVFIICCFE